MSGRPLRAIGYTLVAGALLAAGSAVARSSSVFPYPAGEVWPTAIRYLRIDRGAILREKDVESGYVLFDLAEGNRSYKGSLELVRITDSDGRESTRVVATLPDLPRHYESTLLDKLAAKVREEYGSPAPPPPARAPDSDQNKNDGKRRRPDAGSPPRAPSGDLPRPEYR